MRREKQARERSLRAVEMLGGAIDVKISELTESNRQLKRKIFDLYTIFEISRNFNAVLNYNTLVDSFLLTSLGQVGASSAALLLPPDEDVTLLRLAKSKGLTDPARKKLNLSVSGPVAKYLKAGGKPLAVGDLIDNLKNNPEIDSLRIFRHGLMIPLIMKSELRGLLFVGAKMSGGSFTNDDIEFLSILANQFVVALENARLYESEKNALEELKIAQDQLVISERQAAIGELSARIAHEVNNPLSIISNYLHLCHRNMHNIDQAHEYLEIVNQELSRIARIVRQLLDFHRPHKAEKVPLSPVQIIEDVLTLVGRQLEDKNFLIDTTFPEKMPTIIGSPDQLKQVFLNLIINAKDAMPGGGRLKIVVENHDNKIKIIFTDDGPGITEDILPRLFEPFFTTKGEGAGTGLGLSVCFGIIQEHNGRIEADNDPDAGGRITIWLPVATGAEEKK